MPDSCSGAQSYYMGRVSARLDHFSPPRRRWWPTCPPACTPGSISDARFVLRTPELLYGPSFSPFKPILTSKTTLVTDLSTSLYSGVIFDAGFGFLVLCLLFLPIFSSFGRVLGETWIFGPFSMENTYKSCFGHEKRSMAIFHPFIPARLPLSYPLQKELGRSMKKPSRTALDILIFTTLVWEKSYFSCFDHEEGPILHFFWVFDSRGATTYLLAKELCKSTE